MHGLARSIAGISLLPTAHGQNLILVVGFVHNLMWGQNTTSDCRGFLTCFPLPKWPWDPSIFEGELDVRALQRLYCWGLGERLKWLSLTPLFLLEKIVEPGRSTGLNFASHCACRTWLLPLSRGTNPKKFSLIEEDERHLEVEGDELVEILSLIYLMGT